MQLIDTHCHIHEANLGLASEDMTHKMWGKLGATPDDMLARAAEKGVSRVICVGCTFADSERAVAFAQNRPKVWASVGLHPHEAKDGQPALDGIAALAGDPKVVAIGEIGLDYYYGHSERDDQIKALKFQIELALSHNLPIIFHVRDAFDDFWSIFDSYKGIRGVLHSYTDNFANFEQAMQRDLYIGVNGIMTFTKIEEQLRVAKTIPLQKLLLETDAPFLTPKPFRGTVNEPAHVGLVAEFLADLRNESVEHLADHTTRNAQTLFSLD